MIDLDLTRCGVDEPDELEREAAAIAAVYRDPAAPPIAGYFEAGHWRLILTAADADAVSFPASAADSSKGEEGILMRAGRSFPLSTRLIGPPRSTADDAPAAPVVPILTVRFDWHNDGDFTDAIDSVRRPGPRRRVLLDARSLGRLQRRGDRVRHLQARQLRRLLHARPELVRQPELRGRPDRLESSDLVGLQQRRSLDRPGRRQRPECRHTRARGDLRRTGRSTRGSYPSSPIGSGPASPTR